MSDAGLRAAAEAATPGPWVSEDGEVWWPSIIDDVAIAEAVRVRDAEHIATFDPPMVLGLLDRLEAAEAKVARVEDLAAELQHLSLPGMTDWDYGEMILAALTGEDQ